MTTKRQERVVLYFLAVAYGVAWLIWLPLLLGPAGLRITGYKASLPLFASLGTLGPFAASFLAARYETGHWTLPSRLLPRADLRSWLQLLAAPVLSVVAFVVIPYTVCVAAGQARLGLSFLSPLLAVWPNILGGPLEEEFGWRGFLLPRLTVKMGKVWATLLVGIIWASWHLPLIVCHVYAGLSFWYYLPLVSAVSVLASLSYFATGRSILGPVVLHYVFNMCSPMLRKALQGRVLDDRHDLTLVILASMLAVAGLVIAATRGAMGERRDDTSSSFQS